MGDDPPYLPVGTDVSAKYKGAFCEAKIKKVVRNIKCKVTLKTGGWITVNDDVIKGTLRVGSPVEVKQDTKKEVMEGVITKIQDCSQYTVVFDDGDITTLRRSALCLKSGRHFNESETLDQLPLTHPEHFSTPVIAGRRGRRGRAQSEESEGEGPSRCVKADAEPHVGRVVVVEAAGGAERRRPHQPAFPALVVAPTPQIKVKEDYLVRSFKDGRYYTVPKKEAREFRKGSAPLEWGGVEAALHYLNNGVLPPHWDRTALFNEPQNSDDDSSDDEPREEKDHFVAQLYKFMDDRGTPLNRNPTIANRDIDLYRLFRVVQKLGGYNRVTNQNQWKTIADKMGFHPVTTSITNLCKQAYKKFLHSFEDFYRKLGVTLVAHPRGGRTPPAGRSLIRDRDKLPPTPPNATAAAQPPAPTPPNTCSTPPNTAQRTKDKDSDKSETDKSEKDDKSEKGDKKEKARVSDGEDSADNQPLIATAPKIEKEKEKEREKSTSTTTSEEKAPIKPRSTSKGRTITPVKTERTPKRRLLSSKGESGSTSGGRASRRPHASTDSDSSGRASRCNSVSRFGAGSKLAARRSQSANSASSGNTVASGGLKRPRKRKNTEPSTSEPARGVSNVKAQVGDKLKVYYGPTQSESKVTYEAKVIEISSEGMLRVHYTGWNTRYDEWIKPQRIALNVTQHENRNKKGSSINRRVRAKRNEESSTRSDSDTSDSDEDVKRPPKKSEDKSGAKTPSRSKDSKSSDSGGSSKPRKRPIRTITTPTNVSPAKKPRPASTHQGRDYDLNEIRSELKGFNTVKQEPDEIKQEVVEKEPSTSTAPVQATPPEPTQPDKQAEDVYEFKEPEPFELELHDEKKKRTHRIFDDISPSKYTSTLSKSLSEEIAEDPLRPRPSSIRSPSLSPFRDFGNTRDGGRQSPEDDSKDGLFSLDDDSFQGDGSSGPTFEGFTPAKNQETYSKKSKVSKLRELIDDSPDSPADDEQSSEDEVEDIKEEEVKQETKSSPVVPVVTVEETKPPEQAPEKEEPKPAVVIPPNPEPVKEVEEAPPVAAIEPPTIEVISIPEPPKTPPPIKKIDIAKRIELPKKMDIIKTSIIVAPIAPTAPTTSNPIITEDKEKPKEDKPKEEEIKLVSIPLPAAEPKETPLKVVPPKMDVEPVKSTMEPPSSPLIDTEEDKSEPDSPARIDVLPEPPPGFLLQSEGPKIAEKLLKAISSAKRLSMSPPALETRPDTPKIEPLKITKPESKLSPISPEPRTTLLKTDPVKIPAKICEPIKKTEESIFGEPSNLLDIKRDMIDIKKKVEERISPRIQSPLNILERRKSVADLPLNIPGKNNKVLSDTIQKLSSQINQTVASVTNIPLPTFAPEDRSDSSDSDDSDRRLIIDKCGVEEWGGGGVHAGKSPGEWSAGHSLLMLEDACKNERKHSASVVVAGSGRAVCSGGAGVAAGAVGGAGAGGEDDSSISLLLCEETIPGSPAPPADHAPFAPNAQHAHAHNNEERRGEGSGRGAGGAAEGGGGGAGWGRRALLDNTPPTTPDSSLDMSPHRERRISERDSPSERKDDEDDRTNDAGMDIDKPHGVLGRSRKASESSGRGRRRARRDTDDSHAHTHKYNFYVDLDPTWDSQTRISVLTSRLSDLRKAYHSVKAELAAIDRRRKKLRRKEREAVKAAKAACS